VGTVITRDMVARAIAAAAWLNEFEERRNLLRQPGEVDKVIHRLMP
jgi:hypothetical protein